MCEVLTSFTAATLFRKDLSSRHCFSFFSSNRSSIHCSPIFSDSNSERPGLQRRSQRRGVIPFVLFWNFSGLSSKNSLKLHM